MRMTFRTRGVMLPDWGSETGFAANRVWLEYLRREQRVERARVEHGMIVAYALAGSPHAEAEKRFEVVDPSKQTLFAHMSGKVHQTRYKRHLLEKQMKSLEMRKAEMARIDWIASDHFSLAEWLDGK